jgi:2-oxoglutarate ferredoxin oxidoreductase subunit beta
MNQGNGTHPLDAYLRVDRIPHMWCPGCGLGIAVGCLLRALIESEIQPNKVAIVAGIGCSGRAAGYIKLDSFHVTHGRAIPFATGLKLANPQLKVVVIGGDGDIAAIGGNHFIHAARRNVDITVLCVNNFIYGMTGGQLAPTTPINAKTTTSPRGNTEPPFNLPDLAASAGAVYVARWTTFHAQRLQKALKEALLKKGFSFVEIISPCPGAYGRINSQAEGVAQMRDFRDNSLVKHNSDLREINISLGKPIIVGNFLDVR